MENWEWTCFLLCAFGLLKELRPSEPFVTEYIVNFKNVTADQVIHDIFPVSTYTILGTIVIVFLVTDFVKYRPIIVVQGTSYVLTWIFLIWGQSLLSLQVVQVFYGIAISADVAYYTYIYAKVSRQRYKNVTSYTRTAALIGKFMSGTLSQVLTSLDLMNFHQLNYITLASVSTSLFVALLLPNVQRSIYFYRAEDQSVEKVDPAKTDKVSVFGQVQDACGHLWFDFKNAYRNPHVLRWSIWWAMATAGMLQAQNYIQALWKVVEESDAHAGSTLYNGAVNAVQCLLSAIFSLAVGHIQIEWRLWGESFLSLVSFLQGFVLAWLSLTTSVAEAYAAYVTFRVLYQVVITVANAEVAQGISRNSCALIFGVNTFLALVIQSILTLTVSDTRGLALDERSQFTVYAVYFALIGGAFLVGAIFSIVKYNTFSKVRQSEFFEATQPECSVDL